MSHINVARERVARVQGFGPDYYCMPGSGGAKELEEDWSDLRWGLSHLPASVERDQILQALIVAENAAAEYLDEHGPATLRPQPEWMEEDDENE